VVTRNNYAEFEVITGIEALYMGFFRVTKLGSLGPRPKFKCR